MIDLYLKAADEAEMNAALIDAGLAYEETVTVQTGEDEEGEPITEDRIVLRPAFGADLDIIGPISRVTGYDEDGEPIVQTYPEWHVNVRCGGLTEEQFAQLQPVIIVPPEAPYRVWA
jgi:hypothetical protein